MKNEKGAVKAEGVGIEVGKGAKRRERDEFARIFWRLNGIKGKKMQSGDFCNLQDFWGGFGGVWARAGWNGEKAAGGV